MRKILFIWTLCNTFCLYNCIFIYNKVNTIKITFNPDEVYLISIGIPEASVYTKDRGKINKIIKYLNSFSYSDGSDLNCLMIAPIYLCLCMMKMKK